MATATVQIVRQWLLLKKPCVTSAGKTVAHLLAVLEVTDKTIRRDLVVFRDANRGTEVVRYVAESNCHLSQQCERGLDGSLLVHLDLSGTTEVKSWALSFGKHAEVLEPKSLRDDIRQELTASLDGYGRRTERGSTHTDATSIRKAR